MELDLLLSKIRSLIRLVFRNIGTPTVSEPHRSAINYPKRKDAMAIVLFGTPRSGTTTFQKGISKGFRYNLSFEPIAFNDSKYDPREFAELGERFKYSSISNHNSLLKGVRKCRQRDQFSDNELSKHADNIQAIEKILSHLIEVYGSNVVIKEVRLLTRIPLVIEAIRRLASPVLLVLLKSDPRMTLYSYYRMCGLNEMYDPNCLLVNEGYRTIRSAARSEKLFPELTELECRNKWERLMVRVLIEQNLITKYLEEYPNDCLEVKFENPGDSLGKIGKKIGDVPIGFEFKLKAPRFSQDKIFQKLYEQHVCPALLEKLTAPLSMSPPVPCSVRESARFFVTYLQQTNTISRVLSR